MEIGKPFRFRETNPPMEHLTVSEKIGKAWMIFSLGRGTSISRESYETPCVYLALDGDGAFVADRETPLPQGCLYFSESGECLGKKTENGFVYLEWSLEKETKMNEIIKAGEAFALKDLLPYQKGKIVNLTLMENPSSQLALLAMAEGTELTPHKAPGEALLLILDGNGIISYEGEDHPVQAGDSFAFAKNGLHAVKAVSDFKFALLLEF